MIMQIITAIFLQLICCYKYKARMKHKLGSRDLCLSRDRLTQERCYLYNICTTIYIAIRERKGENRERPQI